MNLSQQKKEQKTRILHILASSIGGGASHVFDLIAQGNSDLEQRLAVSPDGGEILGQLSDLGYEIREIDMAKGWKWGTLALLIRYMKKYQPQIVHCHGFRAGLYGRLASKLAFIGTKTILTVHGFHFYYSQSRLKKKLLIFLERLLRPLTNYVIAVSETDSKHLLECGLISRERSRVVLNGIQPIIRILLNRTQIRASFHLSNLEQPIIATVARLHHQKGVAYFIEAIPQILKFQPNARFLIIGDGPEREELSQIAKKLNIFEHIQFLGNRKDVVDILNVVDVFVLASLWEGLPLSILEAMRAEVPIIATDVDGNRDVIQHMVTGLLVPPKNSGAIANAVIYLSQNPQLVKSLVENAKVRLASDFSLTNMLEKTRQIYLNLVKQ